MNTVAEFLRNLEKSGFISAIEAVALQKECDAGLSANQIARRLVDCGRLTAFQAGVVLRGKPRALVLGQYLLLEKLGSGGMGQVFKARHRLMERIVALKTLRAKAMRTQGSVARFYREAKTLAHLIHPNIVAAFDAGEARGVHFLVMEYVEGIDLYKLVRRDGPLPVEQALECILQAARGLQYAHSKGMVHRDIKPSNLMLNAEGQVKVLDLGLARFTPIASPAESDLTGSDIMVGTLDYMSPEQALDSRHADHRADIYSLGCTFWYLLTGTSPYDGATPLDKALNHRDKPIPSLRAVCAEITPQVENLSRKMLAKRPEQRYASMGELIAAIKACLPLQDIADATARLDATPPPWYAGIEPPALMQAPAILRAPFAVQHWAATTGSFANEETHVVPQLASPRPRSNHKKRKKRKNLARHPRQARRQAESLWLAGIVLAGIILAIALSIILHVAGQTVSKAPKLRHGHSAALTVCPDQGITSAVMVNLL
jgi:serine/threonine protein kinase